jgi:hypothetical protein
LKQNELIKCHFRREMPNKRIPEPKPAKVGSKNREGGGTPENGISRQDAKTRRTADFRFQVSAFAFPPCRCRIAGVASANPPPGKLETWIGYEGLRSEKQIGTGFK